MVSVNRSLLMHLPEIVEIQRAAQHAPRGLIELKTIAEVHHKDLTLPVIALDFGARSPEAPTFFLTAGVHGLERIGSRVVNSFVKSLISLAHWDDTVRDLLERVRFVVVPIVNPIGMYLGRRSNGNGVDLMRNAPIDAVTSAAGLAGGHRISPLLPWYRGKAGAPMEVESDALCRFFESEFSKARSILALDVHSGFGSMDRLWFPYAKSSEPFPNLPEVYNLMQLLDRTYPHHIYKIEPQSKSYTTHGDLWDYLYDRNRVRNQGERVFMPLTLELGSWLWIKKNPIQMFSALGIFNPLLPHRTQRILRRHVLLLDYLLRAAASPTTWIHKENAAQQEAVRVALQKWYPEIA